MGKKYTIKTVVEFYYESEIDEFESEAQAEEFGYDFDNLQYDGVYSVEVDETETCDDCGNDIYDCGCEEAE